MPLPAALEVSILNAFELIKPVVSAGCLILTILYLSRRCLALNYEIPSPGQLDLHCILDNLKTSAVNTNLSQLRRIPNRQAMISMQRRSPPL